MKQQELAELVRTLKPRELAFLRACTDRLCAERGVEEDAPRAPVPRKALPGFAVPDEVRHLTSEELERVELAFRERMEQARNGRQRLSRSRIWLVFLLLRYGGLRLAEALAFDDLHDVAAERDVISVRGQYAREVPLSPAVLAGVREVLAEPEAQALRGRLTRLDEGYLRRCFYARAKECGLPSSRLSARVLRNSRAIELCRGGMPLKIVYAFLGQQSADRTAGFLQYSEEDAKAIIHHYLHKEMKMRTSARNVFPGRITNIRRGDVLVEVDIATFTGLKLISIITEQSRETLGLETGRTVTATVKAPWVILVRPDAAESLENLQTSGNRFLGRVSGLRRSDVATEVEVDLPEGSRVCALITTESCNHLDLKIGDSIVAIFKAFSVILGVE